MAPLSQELEPPPNPERFILVCSTKPSNGAGTGIKCSRSSAQSSAIHRSLCSGWRVSCQSARQRCSSHVLRSSSVLKLDTRRQIRRRASCTFFSIRPFSYPRRRVAELRLEQEMTDQRLKPGVDGAPFAAADFIDRCLHVVVNPALRNPAQRCQRMIMRVVQHLLRLQGVRPPPAGAAA